MLYVGTSGWQYRDWREVFYPRGLASRNWLEHYASCFRTVEVNNTFYRLPPPETFAGWARSVPDDFVMGLKVSRYLTHYKQLREPQEPVARFLASAAPLGERLGPVLLQLPPTLRADPARLAEALEEFPPGVRVAVEFRHPSWFDDEVAAILTGHNAALCLVDRRSRVAGPLWRTADWAYVRLHEGRAQPWPCYGDTALASWAERLATMWAPADDAFVFFNNDPGGCAVRDATRFARLAERQGLRSTRTPTPNEIHVAAH